MAVRTTITVVAQERVSIGFLAVFSLVAMEILTSLEKNEENKADNHEVI